MKVLVTGAGGFIGTALVADRVARGDEVVALDVHDFEAPDAVARHVVDVGRTGELQPLLEGVEVVFHLAAAHLDQSTPESEYDRINIGAARDLVATAREVGVRRIVHTSSVGIYGDVAAPPVPESGPKAPGNVYERTKLLGEEAVLEEAAAGGVEVVVLRPAWVYGATCPRTRRLLRAVARGRFFYFGSGRHLRHPVHIEDTLHAYQLAVAGGASGGIYNIAGPRPLPLEAMIGAAARALGVAAPRLKVPYWLGWCGALAAEVIFAPLGKTPPITRRSLVFFANTNAYSIEAARSELGFDPGLDIDDGMNRVVAELGGKEGVLDGTPPRSPEPAESRP